MQGEIIIPDVSYARIIHDYRVANPNEIHPVTKALECMGLMYFRLAQGGVRCRVMDSKRLMMARLKFQF